MFLTANIVNDILLGRNYESLVPIPRIRSPLVLLLHKPLEIEGFAALLCTYDKDVGVLERVFLLIYSKNPIISFFISSSMVR